MNALDFLLMADAAIESSLQATAQYELEQMLDPSEEMLLRLDRCAAEVSQLSNEATEAENERILEEIQKLIDTTKYYKDAL